MMTEQTIQTNVTEAEEIFCFFKLGKEGSFMTSLINTIFKGDDKNQAKIAKGYPELVQVIQRYGNEKGYWSNLVDRWNKEYPMLKLVA
jgi:hypothetical protein